jgi:glycosyltransferase involved in cell wall biosynthesis
MAKRWVAAGHEVQVITCAPNVPNGVIYEGYRNRLKQTQIMDGIQVTRVWTYIAPNKGTLRRTINYLSYMVTAFCAALFARRPDVIIATSPQFFCGWTGAMVAKLRRLPFILEIRDVWPASIVAVGAMRENLAIRFLKFLELKMYRMADHIVTVGQCYSDDLARKGVPAQKMSVIMNGVDPEVFRRQEPDGELRRKLGLDGEFLCSYIGTVGMASGLGVVLRAGKLLQERNRKDIKFMIVGDGAIREGLQAQVESMGLTNVIFTGLQPKNMIPKYLSITNACLIHLRSCDVFEAVMPSKIFEAAGMAKPIIIGVRGFAEQFVLRARAGIAIRPENEDELVDAVVQLADNKAQAAEMAESGYRHVMAHHTRDTLAQDYLKTIAAVAGYAKGAAGTATKKQSKAAKAAAF